MSQKDLESLRSQIDGLNLEFLRLINERAAVVDEIGKIKEKQGVNAFRIIENLPHSYLVHVLQTE